MSLLQRLKEAGYLLGTAGLDSGKNQSLQWQSRGVVADFALTKVEIIDGSWSPPDGETVVWVDDLSQFARDARRRGFEFYSPQAFLNSALVASLLGEAEESAAT